MNGFALDTNITSFHLKENKTVGRNLNQKLEAKVKILIPPFVYYEVKRGLVDANATKQLRGFGRLLEDCPVGPISQAVFEVAVDIYVGLKARGRLCDENDIYIAAWNMKRTSADYADFHGLYGLT